MSSHPAVAPHHELLARALHIGAAGNSVVGRHRLRQLVHRQPVATQGRRLGDDLELPDFSTERIHTGGPGHGLQDRSQHPVLERPQLHEAAVRALQRVLEHLTQTRRDRAEAGFDTVGQLIPGTQHPFENQLAGEVDVGAILEDHRHHRQSELGQRANLGGMGNARTRSLDRVGHELLDLQRRQCRRLGDDRHLDIGDIGKRIDGETTKGARTGDHQKSR